MEKIKMKAFRMFDEQVIVGEEQKVIDIITKRGGEILEKYTTRRGNYHIRFEIDGEESYKIAYEIMSTTNDRYYVHLDQIDMLRKIPIYRNV